MGQTYGAGTARVCRRRPNGVSNNGYITGPGFSNVDGFCVRNYCLYISTYYYPESTYAWTTGPCQSTTTSTTTTGSPTTTTTTTTSTTTSMPPVTTTLQPPD